MRALTVALALGAGLIVFGRGLSDARPDAVGGLKPAADFSTIGDNKERAIALFAEAGKVIQSPRCLNCHPANDRPLQGDDGHPHQPLVASAASAAWGRRACIAPRVTDPQISIRAAYRATRCGIWPPSKWHG